MARRETLGILHLSYRRDNIERGQNSVDRWQESQKLLAWPVATQVAFSLASMKPGKSARDPLTGLFNRRFMQDLLGRELQRASRKSRPVAVIFVDIDHFKKFNHLFGHDAGDSVLHSFAELLQGFFGGEDVVCHYGGGAFALILPESNEQDAAIRMEQFGKHMKGLTILHGGKTLDRISISVGVAAFPTHGSNSEVLLREADRALYVSKAEGRDRVSIATGTHVLMVERLS